MVIPLMKQAADEHHRTVPVRYVAVWDTAGTSIADTRHAVRTLLARAGHRPTDTAGQDAQLVTSELVTNALRHAPGPGGLVLELSPDGAFLRITVRDSSPRPPRPLPQDARRVGGHGLHLVSRLCDRFRTVPLPDGKQVVAELSLRKSPLTPSR
ncbi:ATP-binding protein [Streptomyces sp. NPDC004065]|uniref:ATP-binding protein n=1 Tax=Streptomyces sp. NPDC004065 TaxID=3364689 RepID=UPI00384C825D